MLLIFVNILKTYYTYFKLKLHDCMCIAIVSHKHARVSALHMLLSEQQCWYDYVNHWPSIYASRYCTGIMLIASNSLLCSKLFRHKIHILRTYFHSRTVLYRAKGKV